MKTLIKKTNLMTTVFALTLLLSTATYAKGNLDNAKTNSTSFERSKAENAKSTAQITLTGKNSLKSFEKELNAITQQISETVKFRVNTSLSEAAFNENETDLYIITEEIAKSVKFVPAFSL